MIFALRGLVGLLIAICVHHDAAWSWTLLLWLWSWFGCFLALLLLALSWPLGELVDILALS